jgi:hypothetical protein
VRRSRSPAPASERQWATSPGALAGLYLLDLGLLPVLQVVKRDER